LGSSGVNHIIFKHALEGTVARTRGIGTTTCVIKKSEVYFLTSSNTNLWTTKMKSIFPFMHTRGHTRYAESHGKRISGGVDQSRVGVTYAVRHSKT